MKRDKISAELNRLYKASGGRLHAPDVVKAARVKTSPLHSQFTWDDSEAANEYRLIQARRLIARVLVTLGDDDDTKQISVRAYQSIRSERNGYRHTVDVLNNDDLRDALLSQLADDLRRVKENYKAVSTLATTSGLFKAIDEFVGSRSAKELARN